MPIHVHDSGPPARTFIPRIGSLTRGPFPVIIHGCNRKNRFASGVAKAVGDDLPYAKAAYHKAFDGSTPEMGSIIVALPPLEEAGPVVLNAITQENYGRDGRVYVSYEAIERAFTSLSDALEQHGLPRRVGLPRIGAGLGGGDWRRISEIILRATAPDIELVLCDLPASNRQRRQWP